MKNNITEIVFILDRSGSMSGFEADTIGGFNATIEKQKEQDGKVYVSTVLFDNVYPAVARSSCVVSRSSCKEIAKAITVCFEG